MQIPRILRQDPLLTAATLFLWICACIPLFVTPFLPMKDMPYNAANAALLWPTAFGDPLMAQHFKINSPFVPYWTTYLLFTVLNRMAGPLIATKIVVALLLIGLPLAVMRLLSVLGRNPRLGLWAFLLTWDHNLYWGWLTFQMGMIFALLCIAELIRAQTLKQAMLRVFPLSLLVGFSHIHAIGLLGVSAIFLSFTERPFIRRLLIHGLSTSGACITLVGWMAGALASNLSAKNISRASSYEWHTLDIKASKLFQYTLDNIPGEKTTAIAFLVLLIGPLLLASAKRGPQSPNDKTAFKKAIAVLCAPLVLYLSLPMAVRSPVEHWHTYPRYATYILLGLLLLPKPRLDGKRFALLIPGIIAAFYLDRAITRQFASFGSRAAPFLSVIAPIPPHSKVLPLAYEGNDPSIKIFPAFGLFHAYVAPLTSSYSPYLWDHPSNPLLYKQENRLPRPTQRGQTDFSIAKHAKYYDYILVQGLAGDPIPKKSTEDGIHLRLLREGGMFRLYAVERSSP